MTKPFWRILAIILTLVWVIVLISNNYLDFLEEASNKQILIDNVVNGFYLFLCIILIIFPTNFRIYALMCCCLGIEGFIYGTGTNAIIIYALGCTFAYVGSRCFQNKVLVSVFIAIPIITLLFQLRFSTITFIESFLDLLFLLVVLALAYVLLKEKLGYAHEKEKAFDALFGSSPVDKMCLTAYDWDLITEVIEDRTFSAIGKDRFKSESAIKKQMVGIYKKLGIKTKQDLLDLHNQGKLKKPE